MARPAPRRKEQHVDTLVVARADEARGDRLGPGGDAAQAVGVDGEREVGGTGAPLDLDEGDRPAATGDEIHLAARRLHPAGQDAPALEPQIPGGERLAASSSPLGLLAPHRSSIARA